MQAYDQFLESKVKEYVESFRLPGRYSKMVSQEREICNIRRNWIRQVWNAIRMG